MNTPTQSLSLQAAVNQVVRLQRGIQVLGEEAAQLIPMLTTAPEMESPYDDHGRFINGGPIQRIPDPSLLPYPAAKRLMRESAVRLREIEAGTTSTWIHGRVASIASDLESYLAKAETPEDSNESLTLALDQLRKETIAQNEEIETLSKDRYAMHRQRDALKEEVDMHYTELESRRTAMADALRFMGFGCNGLNRDEFAPAVKALVDERDKLRSELDASEARFREAARFFTQLQPTEHLFDIRSAKEGDVVEFDYEGEHYRIEVQQLTESHAVSKQFRVMNGKAKEWYYVSLGGSFSLDECSNFRKVESF